MARPSKYTPERADKICQLLRAGCTRRAAYGSAGVGQDAFLDWLRRFPDFADSVTRAECDAEAVMTATIQKAAVKEGDWRAAESWLKRRRRDEWGDNVSLDLDREIAELMAKLAGPRQEETPGGTAAGG